MMPAYNFQMQFVPKILNGSKSHTIRRIRKHPTKVDDTLKLFSGMRTKKCFQFAEVVCTDIKPIKIYLEQDRHIWIPWVTFDEESNYVLELAQADGFDSADAFFKFFELYKQPVLEDFEIIYWDPKAMKRLVSLLDPRVDTKVLGRKASMIIFDDPFVEEANKIYEHWELPNFPKGGSFPFNPKVNLLEFLKKKREPLVWEK
jgi:hypothetical protein